MFFKPDCGGMAEAGLRVSVGVPLVCAVSWGLGSERTVKTQDRLSSLTPL